MVDNIYACFRPTRVFRQLRQLRQLRYFIPIANVRQPDVLCPVKHYRSHTLPEPQPTTG